MAVIDWESKFQSFCEKIGASHAGLARLEKPLTWSHYESWLSQGFAGEMTYLSEHAGLKENPQTWRPEFRSSLVFAFPYVEHPHPRDVLTANRTALYSRGYDYHYWIKGKLAQVMNELREILPGEVFETHTDSSPLLERDLAARAGLGWFGKNTCLIHPQHGSLFLIGEILTTMEFDYRQDPIPDFCGKCQRCMEACPTKAITSERVVDATKCISYLTIEAKQIPSVELRSQMGDWLFGCDICQTVCPWNQKVFKGKLEALGSTLKFASTSDHELEKELLWLLESSNHQILKKVKGTPYYRAGAKGLKRNALIVTANRRLTNLRRAVEALVNDEYLGELAKWTLAQI